MRVLHALLSGKLPQRAPGVDDTRLDRDAATKTHFGVVRETANHVIHAPRWR